MAASSLRATTATTSLMTPLTAALQPTRPATVDSARTLLKTHKGAAKRWRKTANGYKRGKASHNHGNVGWGNKVVSNLRGTSLAKGAGEGNHLRKLKRLLPYA
ncbi:similar to Saccharomyces cerevisiae YNL122C Putative protein of unknown function [Geotrichum candidum]|uniref:50S ribosomal protein L35 n=1 Tax=Geotrichum candidum TaxID=1173061 RepID=A0A0J9X2W3_GEOCN|nr:similar to Saccharomyces cerevisiae YNL122C Putative protein of unknown function [Geotrichum candidum]